jgi:ABC-type dipeptide/oligopeptide/nickel transport system ATPase component
MSSTVLRVHSLDVTVPGSDGKVNLLDGIDMSLYRGEILGLMGQSGSGKTLTAMALLGMVAPPARVVAGYYQINGTAVPINSAPAMHRIRGRDIFTVFQSPSSALNPTLQIDLQLSEILMYHHGMNRGEARNRCRNLLSRVGLSDRVMDAYPFELSGGMQQRVLIAMALAIRPRVLIADEPTTGLDAITQARILDLFGRLREEIAECILFISHDLRVLLHLTDRIAVMHAGRIVETWPTDQLTAQATHPVTRKIIAAFQELEHIDGRNSC